LPATAVEAVVRIIYFEGMGAEEEGSGLEGRRWSIACSVWGRGGWSAIVVEFGIGFLGITGSGCF
jgi:hypothetical protein